MTIPPRLRKQAGLSEGDLDEFSLARGKLVITPKIAIDASQSPRAEDEYTPNQRRIIDVGIQRGLKDFKKGRSHGPFATAKEASVYIERMAKERAAALRSAKLRHR